MTPNQIVTLTMLAVVLIAASVACTQLKTAVCGVALPHAISYCEAPVTATISMERGAK